MLFASWLASFSQYTPRTIRRAAHRNTPSRRRNAHCLLTVEPLEERCVPATHTWTGAGGNGLWSNSGNWDTVPTLAESSSGDVKLIFPTGVANKSTTDDISPLIVDQISLQDAGYSISIPTGGLGIVLRGGFDPNFPVTPQIDCQAGTNDTISGGPLTPFVYSATNESTSPEIDVTNAGTSLTISAVLSLFGTPVQNAGYAFNANGGSGNLVLSGTNTFKGNFTEGGSGTLVLQNAQALGTTDGGTTIGAGATLDVQANIGNEALTFVQDGDSSTASNSLITSAGTGTIGGTITLSFSNPNPGPQVLLIGGAGSQVISGSIQGAGGVTKVGPGATTLSGPGNSYSGATTVNAGFLLNTNTEILTITTSQFTYAQHTTQAGAGLNMTFNFTADGTPMSYTNAQVAFVSVSGSGTNPTATLTTSDTYTNSAGNTAETDEETVIGSGGFGTMYRTQPSGGQVEFMSLNNFNKETVNAGKADQGLIEGTVGVQNAYVAQGQTSTMTSGSNTYQINGADYVYAFAKNPNDTSVLIDGSVGYSSYIASGFAYSFMVGIDGPQFLEFQNYAIGFLSNVGNCPHAHDLAVFYDSPNNDTFVGNTASATLSSTNSTGSSVGNGGYTDSVNGTAFAEIAAYSFVGGTDTATKNDTTGVVYFVYGPDGSAGWNHPA